MTTPWLTVIGIGEDGRGGLSAVARRLLDEAEIVFGAARHFDLAGPLSAETVAWPSPLPAGIEALAARRGRPTVALTTGDPMWFGLGATLARRFPAEEMLVLPAPSAFSLAAARLGWPLQDVDCLSLHGRPVDLLRGHLFPAARLLCLTGGAEAPQQVADLLADEGYGASRLTVLEHMGGPRERVISGTAERWNAAVKAFHLIAIEAAAVRHTPLRPRVPGLPDESFRHDGKITKREIRAATLAKLQPLPGALLWDVGAGSGAVGIEWMRAARGARAIGLEPRADRRSAALANAAALGTPGLELIDAAAPDGFGGLPAPDAIFLGGGLTAAGVIDAAWAALKSGGRLVANAVTVESEAVLLAAFRHRGGELCRLAVSHASPVGEFTGWRPLMPVTQWSVVKP